MWPFGKNKESLLSKARKLAKKGKEEKIKRTVERIESFIIMEAEEGKTSMTEHVDEDVRDEVLKLIQEKGFEARIYDSSCGWWIRISW